MEQRTSFRKAWSVVYPILLYYVVNYLVVFLLVVLTQAMGGLWQGALAGFIRKHSAVLSAVMKGIGMLAGMAVSLPAWKQEQKSSLSLSGKNQEPKGQPFLTDVRKQKEGVGHSKPIQRFSLGILLGIVTALFFNSLFALCHITESSQAFDSVAKVQFSVPLLLGVVLYGVIAPLSEEVLFRGIVFLRMKKYYSFPIALIGSSLFFGTFHGNTVQALYGTLMGLALAYLYEISGDFFVPLCFHSGANLAVFIVVSVELYKLYVFSVSGCITFGVSLVIISLFSWKYKIFR